MPRKSAKPLGHIDYYEYFGRPKATLKNGSRRDRTATVTVQISPEVEAVGRRSKPAADHDYERWPCEARVPPKSSDAKYSYLPQDCDSEESLSQAKRAVATTFPVRYLLPK